MPFEFFPNTNFHDLNLDYILEKAQKIDDNLRDSQASADAAKASEEAAAASEAAAQLSEEAAAASEAAAKDYADHIADPVSGLVTDWLEDNITQETGYVLDTSLTSPAAAAPAKTVGDWLDKIPKFLQVGQSAAQDTYSGLTANLPVNTFSWVALDWFTDGPVSSGIGWIKTEGIQTDTYKVQYFTGINGMTYTRAYHASAWDAWSVTYPDALRRRGSANSSTADMNDLTAPGMYAFTDPHTGVANTPSDRALIVIVDNLGSSNTVQIAFDVYFGVTYTRYGSGTSWRDWTTYDVRFNPVTQSVFTDKYSGLFANLPRNTVSYLAGSWAGDAPGLPAYYFYVLTIGAPSYSVQLAINNTGKPNYTRYYSSGSWSQWFSWRGMATGLKIATWGDSTTYGEYPGGGSARNGNRWPRVLAAWLEADHVNYGVRGQGLITDWDTIVSSVASADLSDCDLIIAAWAYNDTAAHATLPMGSATDTDPATSCVGKYYDILRRLQLKNSNATVILLTGYGYSSGGVGQFTRSWTFADGSHTIKEFYDTLEEMCNIRGFSCINQARGCWVNDLTWSDLIGNISGGGSDNIHPTTAGYAKYSNYICGQVSAIYSNARKFA